MDASKTKATFAALLLVFAGSANAGDCMPRFSEGWIRLAPGGGIAMAMLAGYGRIENSCTTSVSVVGASSPVFGDVSVHRTSLVDGVSRMRPVPALAIAAGQAATFAPGGLHLMLMRPSHPLEAGAVVPISLRLADGREVRGELTVRGAAR